ncbi:hypothetical protein C922_05353 [Plasmodium inui San Antonio 1]|uniref:Uncharacterized protein n=1 Tax=Plasmodium inui San Antonio 1 TaxID=1237626 RepID=W7AG40_9APIC|nr:hypothetical protein C922_05353 [Plasmodium inui San Antonio 1]EUD64266.1 hypothetical protein C922_05353 [Plasmodium inui San Antonio 1]
MKEKLLYKIPLINIENYKKIDFERSKKLIICIKSDISSDSCIDRKNISFVSIFIFLLFFCYRAFYYS